MALFGNNFGAQLGGNNLAAQAQQQQAVQARLQQLQQAQKRAEILERFRRGEVPQYLPNFFPTDVNGNPTFNNLSFLPNGAPDASQLSTRQAQLYIRKQLGVYDTFAAMSDPQKLETLVRARMQDDKGAVDVGLAIYEPFQRAVVDSPFFQQVKERVKMLPNVTSKMLLQWALDPSLPAPMKIALSTLAEQRQRRNAPRQQNFQSIVARMGQDDPATEQARKEAEESALRVARGNFFMGEGA